MQSLAIGGVLQPSKWKDQGLLQASNAGKARVQRRRSCKVSSAADGGGSGSAGRRMPSLPATVRLKLAAFAAAQRPDGRFRYQLLSIGDLKASASHLPDAHGVSSADITMDASRGLWARVFYPSVTRDDNARPLPVVVYFHGGGFVVFSAASGTYDAFCRRLCRGLGAVVVSVNYRLAPHHRLPAAYDDGVAALRYIDANALPVPVDLSSCFIAGDSAGGNIAHHVVARRWQPPVNRLRVAGAVFIQPLFSGEERTKAELELGHMCPSMTLPVADCCWREFLPEGATRDHVAARVCGRDVDVDSFPPAMVVTGGFDPLKDRHRRYVQELLANKGKPVRLVEYPDAIHGFYLFPELADSGRLMTEIKLFVQEHRSKPVV